jgi:hypothetical protein
MPIELSQREKLIIAAMGAGRTTSDLTPVQAQKLFFLIDREASELSGGPWFDFQPYDYGPFDYSVYHELDNLATKGLISVDRSGYFRTYRLSEQGAAMVEDSAGGFSLGAREYFARVKDWIKSVDFRTLVKAIYDAYPDTKVRSVFVG